MMSAIYDATCERFGKGFNVGGLPTDGLMLNLDASLVGATDVWEWVPATLAGDTVTMLGSYGDFAEYSFALTPEPGSLALLAVGLLTLVRRRLRA